MRGMIDKGHLYLACPPLYRLTQGALRRYVTDDAEKALWLERGLGGKGKIDVQRFKGLGEMDAKDLKDTTMNPATRKLIRVSIDAEDAGETGDRCRRRQDAGRHQPGRRQQARHRADVRQGRDRTRHCRRRRGAARLA
jgi:topoisomerase-4 subunit B